MSHLTLTPSNLIKKIKTLKIKGRKTESQKQAVLFGCISADGAVHELQAEPWAHEFIHFVLLWSSSFQSVQLKTFWMFKDHYDSMSKQDTQNNTAFYLIKQQICLIDI